MKIEYFFITILPYFDFRFLIICMHIYVRRTSEICVDEYPNIKGYDRVVCL